MSSNVLKDIADTVLEGTSKYRDITDECTVCGTVTVVKACKTLYAGVDKVGDVANLMCNKCNRRTDCVITKLAPSEYQALER